MSGYAKLLSSIVTSTIWREDSDVCKVWVTLLALANRNGEVESSIPGLAAICGISVPAVENALQVFQKPDKYSRSKEFEGRRISEIDGGWLVLNYLKHRGYMSKEDRQEKDRIRQQRHRDINKTQNVTCCDIDNNVTRDESRESRHAESREQRPNTKAEKPNTLFADIEKSKPKNGKATRIPEDFAVTDKHRAWAKENNLPSPDSLIGQFCDHFTAKAGPDATKLNWDAAFRNWIRNSLNFKGNGNEQSRQAIPERTKINAAALEGFREYEARRNSQPSDSDGGSNRRETVSGGPDSVR